MRLMVCLTSVLALSAASGEVFAKTSGFQLNNTTWTYVDPDKKVRVRESIDADGNYVENSVSGKHIDHGAPGCFRSEATLTNIVEARRIGFFKRLLSSLQISVQIGMTNWISHTSDSG